MYPEHCELSNPVFLPVTPETCADLLSAAEVTNALATLTYPELAAVLVIQHLAQATDSALTPNGRDDSCQADRVVHRCSAFDRRGVIVRGSETV